MSTPNLGRRSRPEETRSSRQLRSLKIRPINWKVFLSIVEAPSILINAVFLSGSALREREQYLVVQKVSVVSSPLSSSTPMPNRLCIVQPCL